jgi:hypothetical protein
MKPRVSWFGVGLVFIGLALLLRKLNVVAMDWPVILWAIVTVVGGAKIVQGYSARAHGMAFWGTLLFLVGGYNLLWNIDVLVIRHGLVIPALFLAIGVSFLVMYTVTPKDWHLLVPALVFAGLGAVMGLAEMGYLYRWDVEDAVRTYWPAALILFGASLLLSRTSER